MEALFETNLIKADGSEVSGREALADKHLVGSKLYDKFQFERIGFFCVDKESTQQKIVFNLTVGLKEDSGKL